MKSLRIYAVFLRYMFLIRDHPQRMFQIIVWSALDIVLWGFITKYLNDVSDPGFSFTTTLLGAVVLWSVLTRAQQGVSTPALEDIWSRNLLNYFASPLSVGEYATGLMLASLATTIVGFAIVCILAYLFFGFSIFWIGVQLVPFLLMLAIFGNALGILGVAIVFRFGPSAEWFVWPIPAVIQPFVGVFYPVAVLPEWMQGFAYLLPPTYAFEGLRAFVIDGTLSSPIPGLVLALFFLAASHLFFVWIYKRAVRSGAIARFTAENSF